MSINIRNLTATDLRDYAKSIGWKVVPEAIKDKLFVMSSSKFQGRQLVFPIDSGAPDYHESIEIVISKIATLLNQPAENIIAEIYEIKDDTLKFKMFDLKDENSYIPLSYAVAAINGAKELFVSAASTVLKPQVHHPRLNRSEALELIEKSKFLHTEKGSFILKVSSPLNAVDIQANIFGDTNIPFVRQTTLTINKALSELVTAIQTDTLDILVDEIKASKAPFISSNICKAITNFHEEHDSYDLLINFKWSGLLPATNPFIREKIKIQKDYFPRIDEVRRELRNSERDKEDMFMASVERLDGDVGDEGKRAGDIILNLYQDEEIIRARTNLNAENYSIANKAHMTPGAYIKVIGKLHTGNQPRLLTDLKSFDLILP